ncbi:MAG: sulfite exporter TauE/SafE family protein [Gammaproteobacteria bacterium]|nr:sulfite exporter TauE/SafE family protein [Gammaproteobacteria bacterium]
MIVDGTSGWMLLLAASAFVLGGLVKGVAGFGLPLVVISLTSTFMPIEVALAINVIPPFVLNLWQMGGAQGAAATWKRYSPVLIGLPMGIAIGAVFAAVLDASWLVGAVGAVTLAFCLSEFAGWRLQLSPAQVSPAGLATGFVSGFFGSLTTVTGPPLVMYLLAAKASPETFRSALGLFFLVVGFMLTLAFASIGFLSPPLALIGVLMAAPAAAGMWLGRRLSKHVDANLFRMIVLMLLTILGLNLLRRAVFA